MSTQYAFRAQKTSGLAETPSWELSSKIPSDTSAVRCYAYSSDGEWFAYAVASCVHLVASSSTSSDLSVTIDQPNVTALSFSPLSTTLFTFERPIKSDTDVHKNVKAWGVKTGLEVGSWYQKTTEGWEPILTSNESHLIRPTASDILIFSPPSAPRPSIRLKIDGNIKGLFLSSPSALAAGSTSAIPVKAHSEPALAVWVGEKKGAPATVSLYPLSALIGSSTGMIETNGANNDGEDKVVNKDMPITNARKAFYKADKLSVKWNLAGTMALFLAHTDVDNTGKSYYGETNLYLVSLDGSFDGLVELDKEGPIYDFNWSPTSREFTVCYGYMPSRTQVFDSKAKAVHSFGSQHRNFVLYQPQGRLLLSAGYGNLAGGVDIWDVSTRKKVAEFKAANASHCEWSPCGRFILTATLSPRLRVDNGVKIWWCGGQLLHIHPQEELYQASFRPKAVGDIEPFPPVVPEPPAANESVKLYLPKGEGSNGADAKPAGAYRPPGARGALAPDIYKRSDDDRSPSASGISTPIPGAAPVPMFKGGKPTNRYIPGAPPPGAPPVQEERQKKKKTRTKNPPREPRGEANGNGEASQSSVPVVEMAKLEVTPAEEEGGAEEAVAKKIRNLTKKLKAIEDLKARFASGEVLEKTQLKKIEAEASVKAEIVALGR